MKTVDIMKPKFRSHSFIASMTGTLIALTVFACAREQTPTFYKHDELHSNNNSETPSSTGQKIPISPQPRNVPAPPATCNLEGLEALPAMEVNSINGDGLFTKQKIKSPTLSPITYSMVSARLTTFNEFQLNLGSTAGFQQIKQIFGHLAGVPLVGNYRSHNYNFRLRLALIQLPKESLPNILPHSLRHSLATTLGNGTTIDNLFEKLQARDPQIYMQVLGEMEDLNDPTLNHANFITFHPWNMLFHPVQPNPETPEPLSLDDQQRLYTDFNDLTSMGIFGTAGAFSFRNSSSISFNEFTTQSVYYHHPAFSPENAMFGVIPACGFSSFWAAAISPDLQHINLTYFLLAHHTESETQLAHVFRDSNSIQEIIQRYQHQKNQPDTPLSISPNQQIVERWIKTLAHSVAHELNH